jgi:hypothetical protein
VIIRKHFRDGHVKVTFTVPDDGRATSVVADFNDWNPYRHPLRRRGNGTRSVAVLLPPGERVRFRYLAGGGHFYDDPDGDHVEPNGYGETHTVIAT